MWPKQYTKERVFASAFRFEDWVEMCGWESLFHSLFAQWISVYESYDQVTETYFTAQKVVNNNKVF